MRKNLNNRTTKGEIGETTVSVGDFNTLYQKCSVQWQNSKDIVEFNIISQLDYNGHLHLEIMRILLKLTNWSIHQDQSHFVP